MWKLLGFEIEYVFGIPYSNKSIYTENDRRMSKLVMNYWANFAKHGIMCVLYVNLKTK